MKEQVRPRIDKEVHQQLDVYRAQNGHDTISDAVGELLENVTGDLDE